MNKENDTQKNTIGDYLFWGFVAFGAAMIAISLAAALLWVIISSIHILATI